MRVELYILGAQVFDFIITKEKPKQQIGFDKQKEKL